MTEPIRIANCSGYFGDRASAAREMVEGGPIDVLTGDWLAELTMLILSRIRAKKPGGGYAGTFVAQMEEVMGTCLDRGIKVVTNAGGLDPDGCADAVAEVADRLGLAPRIAWVGGDDLMGRVDELVTADALGPFDGDESFNPSGMLTANAYLGCWGIVDALSRGADIVITGRTTDAAVVCGPAAWHHGWGRNDLDQLAGAVAAGHVIECSGQATGGNYSFFTEIPGWDEVGGRARFGYPWAEIAADGSAVIGKHASTGGAVTVGTVTSQILYEIGSPAYPGPDVTARFDALELDQVGPDRVRISGTLGEPPPTTLKVATNRMGGFRNSVTLGLVGLDIEAKAQLCEAVFWDAYPYRRDELDEVQITLSRTDHENPVSNDAATARWTITVKDADSAKVGRPFSNAIFQTALASIPGMHGLSGGPKAADPFGVYQPAAVSRDLVPQYVHLDGAETVMVDSSAPGGAAVELDEPSTEPVPDGPSDDAPLGSILGARSGDKGGNANLGVFARTDAAFAWLDSYLTVERLRELLPETAELAIDRHRLPRIRSLNFVVHELLGDGVAASTRSDAQAKSLGEWLRARVVPIPRELLADSPTPPGENG
jgi:hypothetical protein